VTWAAANGIVEGTGAGTFAPEAEITRQDIAAGLLRYAGLADAGPQGAWAVRLDFADVAEISDYAVEGAMYCYMNGIIDGKTGKDGEKLFDPKAYATRAEAAAMLHRFEAKLDR
jgi:hypothetical protein